MMTKRLLRLMRITRFVLTVQSENVVQGDTRTSPRELWCDYKTKETNRWSTSTSRQRGHGSGYGQRERTNCTGFINVAGFLKFTLHFHAFTTFHPCQIIISLEMTAYDVHLKLIGKRIVDFLLVVTELFSLGFLQLMRYERIYTGSRHF